MIINTSIIYRAGILFAGLIGAAAIVWQPLLFLVLLFGAVMLAVLFWKTEESLLALFFYLPFQIAMNISADIDLASGRILIVIFFMIWLLKSLAGKKLAIPHAPNTWLVFIFLIFAVLSALFSTETGRSAIRLLFFLNIMPLYFVSAGYFNSFGKIKKLVYALIASSGIVAIGGIAQFIGQFIFGIDPVMDFLSKNIAPLFYGQSFSKVVLANPSWLVNIGGQTYLRAISLFPDPHMFAFYLGLIIPLALAILLFSNRLNFSFEKKALFALVNAVLLLALFATFSRAGYFGAVFGIGAVIILGWKKLAKKAKALIAVLILAAAVFFLTSSPPAGGLVFARFFAIFNLSEGSNSERIVNWNRAIKIIENYPLTGVGVGTYALEVDPRSKERSAISAHNTYLDIAAEMGLGALAVWVFLLLISIIKLLSVFRSKEKIDFYAKVISLGFAGSFVWFSVQSFFDTAVYSPVLLPLLAAYFGIAVNLEKIVFPHLKK